MNQNRKQLPQKKLSKEEQILAGIEFLALGWKFIIKEKTMKQADLLLFIDELQKYKDEVNRNGNSTDRGLDSESLRKKYNEYVKKVEKLFGIKIKFQSKAILYGNTNQKSEKLYKICKYYLQACCYHYSDDALQLYFKNIEPENPKEGILKNLEDFLYRFVLLQYMCKFRNTIEFHYRKSMGKKLTSRRIMPYCITVKTGFLSLIGLDKKDNITKSFIFRNVSKLSPEIDKVLKKAQTNPHENLIPFDLEEYEKTDPAAKFNHELITYKLQLFENSYLHFKETYNITHKVLSADDRQTTIEFTSIDRFEVFDITFNYGTFAKLIGPEDELDRFKEKLTSLQNHYNP